MKNNNNNIFRWKRTARGVSVGLLLMCNAGFAQDPADDSTFTLNLKNTDIQSLIATVSKQTGRNFVVDPRVKAKVTVISTDPVDVDGLYEVFLSVLQVHGYSAVPAGDLVKIVPDVTAKQGPVPVLGTDAPDSDQLVTQVITVVNVPAAQLVPILRPMVPQQGHLAAYAATNSLIITDRSSNIQRLMEIIRRIDRPDNEEIEVVRLNHASAQEIVGTLSSLQRNNVGGPQGPGAIQLVADERTNSVLISGDRAVRVRIRGLIAHLDTPIESSGNTRVVYLKFANAEDIVGILQGVTQGQARVGGATTTDNSGGQPAVRPQPQQQQNPNNGQQPNNNPAANPQNNAIGPRNANETGESNVDIQADPNTNALIITAPQDEIQNILAVIRQLDIRRAQVLVEAVIAEITEDNTQEFGINFLLDGTDKDVPIGFTNLGGATDGALGIAGAVSAGTLPTSLGAGLSLALGQFATGEIDFGFLVRAIASDADNNILSTPSIVTLDNEEAEIIVGSNVPFVTGQQLSANNNNPFQTIERQDIGLTLRVTPQINDGNTIKMDIEQEVSSLSPTVVTGAADITTSVRSIRTTVLVEDGQTLVLGGLIDDQVTDVEERVPLLGDIPVLGHLFRFRSTTKNKRNLMVFLHPKILRDSETANKYSNSKYNFLRERQRLSREQQDNSLKKEQKKGVPELKLFFKGKNADGPLTQLDTTQPESKQEQVVLTDSFTESVVKADNDKLTEEKSAVETAGPSKADIEKVIAANNARLSEEVLAQSEYTDKELEAIDAAIADLTAPRAENILNQNTDVAETTVQQELPVANEALVASVLESKVEEADIVEDLPLDSSVQEALPLATTEALAAETPEQQQQAFARFEEFLADSSEPKEPPFEELPELSAQEQQAFARFEKLLVDSSEQQESPAADAEELSVEPTAQEQQAFAKFKELLADSSEQEELSLASTEALPAEPSEQEELPLASTEALPVEPSEQEQQAFARFEELLAGSSELEELPIASTEALPAASSEQEQQAFARFEELLADLSEQETLPLASTEELPAELSEQEQQAFARFENLLADSSAQEPIPVAEIEDQANQSALIPAHIEETPVETDLTESGHGDYEAAIAEVPASSRQTEATSTDGDLINIEEPEVEETDASTESIGEYVDNIDPEEVDRSQDDLADDRPEVFLISVSDGNDTSLTDIAPEPRY